MRALVWHGREDIRCDTVSDPQIEDPRDAIVKVTSCAMFVAHAVEAALGICPLCHGRWPHKEDENGARETSSTKTNSDYHSVRP